MDSPEPPHVHYNMSKQIPDSTSQLGSVPLHSEKEPHQHELSRESPDIEQNATPSEKPPTPQSMFQSLGLLDRFLAVWIFLAMAIGIILGNFVDDVGPALEKGSFVGVSIPIAVGLLVMMYPILCKVKYETLHHAFRTRQIWVQIGFSIVVNWVVAPLLMASPLSTTSVYVHVLTQNSLHLHGPFSQTSLHSVRASSLSASPAASPWS